MANELKEQAFANKNVQLFVWFRVLFNCRFYYPVLAILFVDMGLSLSQYVILNAIWALTIVCLEVPSGALADIIGRKKLVLGSAIIMVAEMALLLFAPLNGGWLLFSICAINRVLAGLAEAAASGADEALAYDSLQGDKKDQQWDEVLATLGRRYSICMAIAVVIGALVYDPQTFSWLHQHLGLPEIAKTTTLRIPVFLCLLQGIAACFIASRLSNPPVNSNEKLSLREIWSQTLKASLWAWRTKIALAVIIGCMLIDSMARNFATIISSFYRHIELPDFSFGMMGAIVSLCSFVVPFYAKPLARNFSIKGNILILGAIACTGLLGVALAKNAWGIVPAAITMMSLYHCGFITSRFLNQIAPDKMRATILSIKGLAFNIGYATFSLMFAQTMAWRSIKGDDKSAFTDVLLWTPCCLVFALLIFLLLFRKTLAKGKSEV